MQHIAIMRKSWGLVPKILSGEKTVESRWYMNRYAPWGKIKKGDTVYFKDSGEPVTVRADVTKVLQFEVNSKKTELLLEKYGKDDLGTDDIMPEIREYVSGKKYCILVFFENVQAVKLFQIDKTGFGMMSSWICVDDTRKFRKMQNFL